MDHWIIEVKRVSYDTMTNKETERQIDRKKTNFLSGGCEVVGALYL